MNIYVEKFIIKCKFIVEFIVVKCYDIDKF